MWTTKTWCLFVFFMDRFICDIFTYIFQGLVVPVIRSVEKMNYADIEKEIASLGEKVKGLCALRSLFCSKYGAKITQLTDKFKFCSGWEILWMVIKTVHALCLVLTYYWTFVWKRDSWMPKMISNAKSTIKSKDWNHQITLYVSHCI